MAGPTANRSKDIPMCLMKNVQDKCREFSKTIREPLSEPLRPADWFINLNIDDTQPVHWITMRNCLVYFIRDVTRETDAQKKDVEAVLAWLKSSIQYVHEMIKQDGKPNLPIQSTPENSKEEFKKTADELRTIRAKLESKFGGTEKKEDRRIESMDQSVASGDQQYSEPPVGVDPKQSPRSAQSPLESIKVKVKELKQACRTYFNIHTTDPKAMNKNVTPEKTVPVEDEIHCELDGMKKLLQERTKSSTKISTERAKQDEESQHEVSALKAEAAFLKDRVKTLEKEKNLSQKDAEQKARNQQDILQSCQKLLSDEKRNSQQLETDRRALEETVRKVRCEYKELELRYSTLAGTKMAHENPDIADLSDPNRPTKLAEKFSELYDNEWTDGFGALSKQYAEGQTIEILMDLLQDANTFCRKVIVDLRQELQCGVQIILQTAVYDSGQGKGVQQSKTHGKTNDPKQKGQPTPVGFVKEKKIDDIMRDNALLPVQSLQKNYIDDLEKKPSGKRFSRSEIYKNKNITPYIGKCVELCWLMSIQSPPVLIDTVVAERRGQPFDDRHFKTYTKKGNTIDYVVWPVMYFAQGGLLGKGVAQCK